MPVDPVFGLRSLGVLTRALSASQSLLPLLEAAAEEALVALKAASVSIGRLEHSDCLVRILVNVGDLALIEDRFPEDETYPLARWGAVRQVMTDGITQTACLSSRDCPPSEAELLKALDKESSVQAAILVDGTIWGEFYATRHSGEEPFAEEAVDYVDVLTAIVGAAISRSERESALKHLAFRDGLTGALNRRGLDEAAASVFDLTGGASRVVTAVAFDVDGLKQVNDQYGHPRGDELLEAVARSLTEAFASVPGSVVARVGGDEFTVLVPNYDQNVVIETVQALCRSAGEGWNLGSFVGISAGVSSTVLEGRADVTPSDLLAAADRALCRAKQHQSSSAVVVSKELVVGSV